MNDLTAVQMAVIERSKEWRRVEALALAWINEVRREHGMEALDTIPERDRATWCRRAHVALIALASHDELYG